MFVYFLRTIFHEDDDLVLNFLDDDGLSVEPQYYMPIIPMVLVNGADGIGTGWSTTIPNYNPKEIVENMKRMIRGEKPLTMDPWYKVTNLCVKRSEIFFFLV